VAGFSYLDINVIRVGVDSFTGRNLATIDYGIQTLKSTYSKVGLYLNEVNPYDITYEKAGLHVTIDSQSEAVNLTTNWTIPNGALDVFVVRAMNGAVGWSAVGGSCDKDSAFGMTGCVVSLEGDRDFVANTFAHEIGHYLGLQHNGDEGNVMGDRNGNSNSSTEIYAWQAAVVKRHCFVYG
jgi:Metallo-peptidase family M12B Reprolysin-like